MPTPATNREAPNSQINRRREVTRAWPQGQARLVCPSNGLGCPCLVASGHPGLHRPWMSAFLTALVLDPKNLRLQRC